MLMVEKHVCLYQALIRSANWLITLGQFDVHYATNTLSHFEMAL